MSAIQHFVDRDVQVVLYDGRIIVVSSFIRVGFARFLFSSVVDGLGVGSCDGWIADGADACRWLAIGRCRDGISHADYPSFIHIFGALSHRNTVDNNPRSTTCSHSTTMSSASHFPFHPSNHHQLANLISPSSHLPPPGQQGKLKGFDLRANVIMSDCVEREFSIDQGVEMVPLGLYMIKGDNVWGFTLSFFLFPGGFCFSQQRSDVRHIPLPHPPLPAKSLVGETAR
jgi:small nuclear ribonucleoprotein (snRNP)-like protein